MESRGYRERKSRVGDGRLQNFYGMIANIDWNLGRLRAFLEAEGLSENTILAFTTTGVDMWAAERRSTTSSPGPQRTILVRQSSYRHGGGPG